MGKRDIGRVKLVIHKRIIRLTYYWFSHPEEEGLPAQMSQRQKHITSEVFWSIQDSQLRQICYWGIKKRILHYGCVWIFSGFGCVSIGGRKKEREREVRSWCMEGKCRLTFLFSQTIIDYRRAHMKVEQKGRTQESNRKKARKRIQGSTTFKWHNKGQWMETNQDFENNIKRTGY